MEPIAAQILQSLAREQATGQLEKAAQNAMVLQSLASHACFTFCKLCEELLRFKETFGKEAYYEALRVLDIDENTVKIVTGIASRMNVLPQPVIHNILRKLAQKTLDVLRVLDGDPGEI